MYGSARAVGHIESSPARSPRLPRSPRLGHRRASSGGGSSGGGKTLSMENIQSLNAAYATSGPMYLSDHEGVGSTATYPKGTMTLGRASNRAMYGGRVTGMGSSPNIATVGLGHHTDLLSYSDLGSLSMLQHHHHHQGVPSALLRQAVRGGGGELLEMQATLRDMQRENDLLRRELDLKDSKLGSSTNSIKSFWSPELKKERMIRKEEAARTSVLKEQMRVTHEENQCHDFHRRWILSLFGRRSVDVVTGLLAATDSFFFSILQTEVDALRLRLEEKESFLNKKTKQLQDLTEEKGTLAGEIRDMKDMLEVKERKINVLQKKIENLQEQLCDKDKQLGNLKDRVKSLQTDSSNTDTALATLEEALSEKERIIERLKEQRAREDNERIDEVESYKKENKDLKEKVNTLHMELTEKESCLIDLKEHASSLASSSLKKESKLKSLEMAIEQKKEECSKLETQLQKQAEQLFTQMNNPKAHEVQQQQVGVGSRGNPEYVEREQRVKVLEKEVSYYKEESGKAQAEVDRLLAILREVETEKNDRDKKIAELESPPHLAPVPRPGFGTGPVPRHGPGGRAPPDPLPPVSAAPQQIGGMVWDFLGNLAPRQTKEQVTKKGGPNLKLGPQGEKKPGQIMGDPRKDNTMDLGQHLKLEEMMNTLERTRQELDATKQRLSSTQQSLQERDGHLTNMRQERRKQLEEILEMKQQALLAAISEKDANIALLELSASGKKKTQEEVLALKREKDRLMHQLKQQTQSRMKLMADNYEDDHYHPHPPFHSLPQQPHLGLQPQSPQPQYQHPPHPQQQHAPYPHAPHPQPPPQQHPHPQQPQQQYSPHPQQHPQGHPQQPQHQPRPQHPLQVQQPHPQQQQHPHPGQHPHGPLPQQQHPHPQQHPQPYLHGPLQQAPHPQHPQQHPHHPIPHAPQQQGGHPRHPSPHHRGGPGPARGPPHAGHRPSHDQDDEEGIWA
ncbi:ERC protein 2-like [Oncorhynchus masou masou]|uniref:ERC protein 2-like n=1 Tax=Oncorhynchus masou masou TaxID=90313 RepID=UPI003183F29F